MKNKKLFIGFIIFDLFIVAIYFGFVKNNGTMNKFETDFSFKDTSKISEIQIIESSDTLFISKRLNSWVVNNSFDAKPEVIRTLLNAIQLFELKSPIPKNGQEFIKQSLVQSKKVNILSNQEILKSFYIKTDNLVNYMMLENSENAYIVHIPALEVDISSIFPAKETKWKSNVIFSLQPEQISEISVYYPENEAKSFIIKKSDNNISFFNKSGNIVENIDNDKVKRYLTYFTDIIFLDFNTKENIENYSYLQPFVKISLIDTSDSLIEILCYDYFNDNQKDINIFVGILNNKELVFVKYYDFDLILKKIEYFKYL